MKKVFALILALVMALSLCACGGKSSGKPSGSAAPADPAAFTPVAGETYDTGMFTVTVPKGWCASPVSDMFDDYEGDFDPTTLNLIKDGKEDWDTLDHAYIRITLYDKDALFPSKSFYDDAKDLDPVTVSGFDCTAFSCTSGSYPYIILEGSNAKNDISISLLTKNDYSSMEFSDADVQTILRSITVK